MKNFGSYLLAFTFGMNLVIFTTVWLIAPEGMSLWDMRALPALVDECEKELTRTETCELVAVPKIED